MSEAVSQPAFTSIRDFEVWADAQPDRWELHDGRAVSMAPERAVHVRIKANIYIAMREAFERGGAPCEALIDGLAVPGPGLRRFIPDVVAVCGARMADDAQVAEEPTILVEVLSPATEGVDTGLKLRSYLSLRSVQHYLVVSSSAQVIVHHRRWDDERFLTAIVSGDAIELAPPGVTIALRDVFAGTELVG